jgi:hypothetical protein
VILIFVLSLTFGCGSVQIKSPPQDFEPTCIQGTVRYQTPTGSSSVPYPYARITAWQHGTDQPLGETEADGAGKYCIEVPLGAQVELKIWGVQRLQGETYTCKGSEENIAPGNISKECGGDCIRIDIITDCGEFQPPYRRQM